MGRDRHRWRPIRSARHLAVTARLPEHRRYWNRRATPTKRKAPCSHRRGIQTLARLAWGMLGGVQQKAVYGKSLDHDWHESDAGGLKTRRQAAERRFRLTPRPLRPASRNHGGKSQRGTRLHFETAPASERVSDFTKPIRDVSSSTPPASSKNPSFDATACRCSATSCALAATSGPRSTVVVKIENVRLRWARARTFGVDGDA